MSDGPLNNRRAVSSARFVAACLLATVAAMIPGKTIAAQARTPKGTLLIVGGGPQPPALVQQFVDLAGGSGKARIVVFAEASADGATEGEDKANDLRKLGAQAQNVWVNRAQANTDSVAHLLDRATGVWFVGGDQVVLDTILRGTKTEAAIHSRYMAGAVIGGTSAGAAVMSEVMLTGDERHPGGDRPDTSTAYMTIARGNIVTDTGFALIRDAIVDQHFLRRKRQNRLMSLVLEREPHLAVGIDESTAIVVHPNGTWTVAGASVAIVYDARGSTITSPQSHVLGATNMRVHVLPAGSTFNPKTGVAKLPK
ncbi:MAG TPA: cyanophycinase [Gemmatimonadaceae bacterium]